MNKRALRMYLHPSRRLTRLSLEGDLTGDWVQELEQCWRALSGPDPDEALLVDVSRLESADPKGYRLLDTMRRQGVVVTGLHPASGMLTPCAAGPWAAIRNWLRTSFRRKHFVATRGHGFHVPTT